MSPSFKSNFMALAAIALWGSLASLAFLLRHLPPFLLTAIALLIGSSIAMPLSRFRLSAWRVAPSTFFLGVYGIFGFHYLFFLALRHAPPVEVNLVNYLWPLGMVVLPPLFIRSIRFSLPTIGAGLLGFLGAALAILGRTSGTTEQVSSNPALGYVLALASAFVWASYSILLTQVRKFNTVAVGGFTFVSGVLSLFCHVLLEPATSLSPTDWALLVAIGLGPLGGAFYLWDAALKTGDPRRIGLMSFITPVLSTTLLMILLGQDWQWNIVGATVLILGAAFWGDRVLKREQMHKLVSPST